MCDISINTEIKEAVIYKVCMRKETARKIGKLGEVHIVSFFARTPVKTGDVSEWPAGKSYDPALKYYSENMIGRTAGFTDVHVARVLRDQISFWHFESLVVAELHVTDLPGVPIMQGTGANIMGDYHQYQYLDTAVVLAAPHVTSFRIVTQSELRNL